MLRNLMSLFIKNISLCNSIIIFPFCIPHHWRTLCLRWELGIVNRAYWTLRNKLLWNFNQNIKNFIHEKASENIVCEMAAILSRGGWVHGCASHHKLGSMVAWCLREWNTLTPGHMLPSHHLNQCSLIINAFCGIALRAFHRKCSRNGWYGFENNYNCRLQSHLPGANELMLSVMVKQLGPVFQDTIFTMLICLCHCLQIWIIFAITRIPGTDLREIFSMPKFMSVNKKF